MSPHRLVGLYPAAWRQRYGDEFLALLETRPPRRLDVIDIAWGALDAHLYNQAPEGGFRMFIRIAGIAAIAAGVALLAGFLGFVIPGINEFTFLAFYALAIVGLVGIHLRQVSVRPALAWFGFVVPLLALAWGIGFVLLTRVGVISTDPGELGYLAGFALWIGSTILGVVMLALRVFPIAVGLAFSIGAPLAILGLAAGSADASSAALDLIGQAGIIVYAGGWLGAGWSLVAAQPEEGVLGSANP